MCIKQSCKGPLNALSLYADFIPNKQTIIYITIEYKLCLTNKSWIFTSEKYNQTDRPPVRQTDRQLTHRKSPIHRIFSFENTY